MFIVTVFVFKNFQKFMYRYLQYDTLLFVKIVLYLSYIIASHGRVCYFHFVYFVEFWTLNPYWLAMPVIRTVEQMIRGFAPYFRLKRSVNNVLNVIIIIYWWAVLPKELYKYISNLYHTEYLYALACPKVEWC